LGLRRLESLSEYSSGDEATGSDDGTINEDRSSSDDSTSGDERTSNSSGSEFMADQYEGTTQLQMRTTTKANPLAMNGMERETEDSESIASEPSDSAAVWDTESVTQDRNIDPPTPPPQPADATIADGSFWPSDDSCGDFENHNHQEDGGLLDFDESELKKLSTAAKTTVVVPPPSNWNEWASTILFHRDMAQRTCTPYGRAILTDS
jgi:hypothetical protein